MRPGSSHLGCSRAPRRRSRCHAEKPASERRSAVLHAVQVQLEGCSWLISHPCSDCSANSNSPRVPWEATSLVFRWWSFQNDESLPWDAVVEGKASCCPVRKTE